MSVLIKGMKIPQNCLICPCLEYNMFDDNIDGYCKILKTEITNSDERHPNCPLVEILTPHGNLVDLSDMVHPNDSMRLMTIDEQLGRTCEGWSAEKKEYIIIKAEGKI